MKNDGGLKLTVDKKISLVVEDGSNMSIALSTIISTLIIEKSFGWVLEHYQEKFEKLINQELRILELRENLLREQLLQMGLNRIMK